MQKAVVKYSIIFLLLTVYINRGLFVTPFEIEFQGSNEINSIIELVLELVTGESNDMDEDGDEQTDCSFTQVFIHDFPQHLVQRNIYSNVIKKIGFPDKESFLLNDFCSRIDHPPQV